MKIKFLFTVLLLTLVLGFQAICYKALAQMSGILVYPNIIDIDFSKDSQKFHSNAVYVENPTKETVRLRAYLTSWKYNSESGIEFLDKPDQFSLNDYVKFYPREFDLAPNQKQMIRITSKIPEGVDGEYRSIIFFETVASKEEILKPDKSNVKVVVNYKTRYGVTLYAYKGIISKNAEINNFNFKELNNKPHFLVDLTNTGNIHTNVEGEISILDKSNQELMKVEAPRYSIFPGLTQTMNVVVTDNELKPGDYKAKIRLTYKNLEDKEEVLEAETPFKVNLISIDNSNKNQVQKPVIDPEIKATPDNVAKPQPVDLKSDIELENKN